MLVTQINYLVEEVIPLSVAITIILTVVHSMIILVVVAVVVQAIKILVAVAIIILREEHQCATAESVCWKRMNCSRVVVILCATVILCPIAKGRIVEIEFILHVFLTHGYVLHVVMDHHLYEINCKN